MKKLIVLALCVFALIPALHAQEITFKAAAPSRVAVGERFKLSFTINSNASGFTPPDLSEFNVFSGPNQSSSVQMINGSFSQTMTFYFVLSCSKKGTFKIGPAYTKVGNGKIGSEEISIEVTDASNAQQSVANPRQGNQGQVQNQTQTATSDKIFVKAIVNKSKVSLGEAISVTYKIYSKYGQINFSDLKFPTFNGFYAEEVQMNKNDKLEVEQYNGSNWYTAELKRSVLFPQKSGKLEIPALEATCLVRERVAAQNFFDQFFGGGFKDVEVKVKSQPHSILVEPHPTTGKPADFSGAVGKFEIESSVDKNDVKSGDAINFKLKVTGTGNLKLLEAPELAFPPEFEAYDPQIKDAIRVTEGGMSGSREFDYLLIPRAGGKYLIGPFTWSYFSTATEKYESVTLPAIEVNVAKGSGDQVISGRSGQGSAVKTISSDVRYLKPDAGDVRMKEDKPFFLSPAFYSLTALPPVALLALLIVRNRQNKIRENRGLYKSREAGSVARKRLKQAGELLRNNEKNAFYDEVFRALYGFLSDRLQIPTASLNKEVIAEKLKSRKVSGPEISELEEILQACEFARFAPGAEANMQEIFAKSEKLITKIDKTLKS
ncbi:MAG: protein BatD [Bacteroidetes bacterium]|nr:protein BatD [Bacteroidota bacterium]